MTRQDCVEQPQPCRVKAPENVEHSTRILLRKVNKSATEMNALSVARPHGRGKASTKNYFPKYFRNHYSNATNTRRYRRSLWIKITLSVGRWLAVMSLSLMKNNFQIKISCFGAFSMIVEIIAQSTSTAKRPHRRTAHQMKQPAPEKKHIPAAIKPSEAKINNFWVTFCN